MGSSSSSGGRSGTCGKGLDSCAAFARRRIAPKYRKPTLDDLEGFDTYIFDCDGVIWGIPDEDTNTSVKMINHLLSLNKRVMFCTNNSNKTRADFIQQLASKGVAFGTRTEEDKLRMMICASYTTARYLRNNGYRRPFCITSDLGLLKELENAGINDYFATVNKDGTTAKEFECPKLVGSKPEIVEIINAHPNVDCVVVGWDLGITAKKVGCAINYIKWHGDFQNERRSILQGSAVEFNQIPIIACSGDAGGVLGKVSMHRAKCALQDKQDDGDGQLGGSFKYKGGRRFTSTVNNRIGSAPVDDSCLDVEVKLRAIGNGAMADIIARSFDPPREWIDMGKPSEALIEMLQHRDAYNVDLSKALMVGDTLQTDIVFGNKGGMRTLLVLSGVTTQSDLAEAARCGDPQRVPTFVLDKLGALLDDIDARVPVGSVALPPSSHTTTPARSGRGV